MPLTIIEPRYINYVKLILIITAIVITSGVVISMLVTHRQTRTSFEIAKETGALLNLDEICTYLIQKLQDVVTCRQIVDSAGYFG